VSPLNYFSFMRLRYKRVAREMSREMVRFHDSRCRCFMPCSTRSARHAQPPNTGRTHIGAASVSPYVPCRHAVDGRQAGGARHMLIVTIEVQYTFRLWRFARCAIRRHIHTYDIHRHDDTRTSVYAWFLLCRRVEEGAWGVGGGMLAGASTQEAPRNMSFSGWQPSRLPAECVTRPAATGGGMPREARVKARVYGVLQTAVPEAFAKRCAPRPTAAQQALYRRRRPGCVPGHSLSTVCSEGVCSVWWRQRLWEVMLCELWPL